MFQYLVIESKDQGEDKVSQWRKNCRWNSACYQKAPFVNSYFKVPHIHSPSRNIAADVKQPRLTDHQTSGSASSLHASRGLYINVYLGCTTSAPAARPDKRI